VKIAAAFGADVDPKTAGFWADSRVPFGLAANNGTVTEPAWREKPSWYFVATGGVKPLCQRSGTPPRWRQRDDDRFRSNPQ
jgi:hypothetical protein